MECPLDYGLCGGTVTLYRKAGDTVTRQVLDNCAFSWRKEQTVGDFGPRRKTGFTLILPGDERILPGDRVLAGVGPEEVDWRSFLPAAVPGLGEVTWVKPVYWKGTVCHVEAGGA